MEVDHSALLFMELKKRKERKAQVFNECKYIFTNIIEKKSMIQKILEDVDPLIKEILSEFSIGFFSIDEYLRTSKWVDWVLDLNRSVGLFNGYGQGGFLPQVIKDLSKTRIELESIELKTLYLEKLLLSIIEETRQVKLLAKSRHWTNEKYRNEIINCIKIIIAAQGNINKKITH
ncbi:MULTISPECIES: hypothetical protein [Bacillus cereus group]|uniref:Uncharacterized protein n=1 Tax=Bacillus thuringiensis TaxID=1428 RepID=A0A9X7AGN2_BACTU|nr:hypothetical protein [Bacillus thuringiensis]MCQ6337659.1 hypothetical protein [Bacillus cereus]PFT34418.1 hypothetical protein COK72_31595 [Bacillus thuringiensis]